MPVDDKQQEETVYCIYDTDAEKFRLSKYHSGPKYSDTPGKQQRYKNLGRDLKIQLAQIKEDEGLDNIEVWKLNIFYSRTGAEPELIEPEEDEDE